MKHRELILKLSKFRAKDSGCDSVYCGGCGGLVFAVRRNMTAELRSEIDDALSEMSILDFKDIGQWGEFFQEINPTGVMAWIWTTMQQSISLIIVYMMGVILSL